MERSPKTSETIGRQVERRTRRVEFYVPRERFEALNPLLAQVVRTNGSVTFARDIHDGPQTNPVDRLARGIAPALDAILDSRVAQVTLSVIAGVVLIAAFILI